MIERVNQLRDNRPDAGFRDEQCHASRSSHIWIGIIQRVCQRGHRFGSEVNEDKVVSSSPANRRIGVLKMFQKSLSDVAMA